MRSAWVLAARSARALSVGLPLAGCFLVRQESKFPDCAWIERAFARGSDTTVVSASHPVVLLVRGDSVTMRTLECR